MMFVKAIIPNLVDLVHMAAQSGRVQASKES